MAITATELDRHVQPGNNYIDYSVTFDSAFAGTLGEAWSFGSNTNFQNHVKRIQVLTHPTGYRVHVGLRTGSAVTSVRLLLQGSASTTSGQNEVAFLALTTAFDAHAQHCQLRVFGD